MQSKWFTTFNKRTTAGTKLFCFPYAGGNAATFSAWSEQLPGNVSVLGMLAPGRASRLMEAPISRMEELVDNITEQMAPLIDGDYAILGHSLGARVSFEVSLKLVERGIPAPRIFIGSGSPAPSIKRTETPIYDLPEPQFVEKLRTMGGTPDEVLDNVELREIVLPAIRADFEIVDKYQGNEQQLNTRAHVFYGKHDDTFSFQDAESWKNHFSGACTLHTIDGDHFFIDTKQDQVLNLLNRILCT